MMALIHGPDTKDDFPDARRCLTPRPEELLFDAARFAILKAMIGRTADELTWAHVPKILHYIHTLEVQKDVIKLVYDHLARKMTSEELYQILKHFSWFSQSSANVPMIYKILDQLQGRLALHLDAVTVLKIVDLYKKDGEHSDKFQSMTILARFMTRDEFSLVQAKDALFYNLRAGI